MSSDGGEVESQMEAEVTFEGDDLLDESLSHITELAETKADGKELVNPEELVSAQAIVPKEEWKKSGKVSNTLRGASMKKRNVNQFVSPRKKIGLMNGVQIGDELYPRKGRKPPGERGGNITPKNNVT